MTPIISRLVTLYIRLRLSVSANRPFKVASPVGGVAERANAHTTMTYTTRYGGLLMMALMGL